MNTFKKIYAVLLLLSVFTLSYNLKIDNSLNKHLAPVEQSQTSVCEKTVYTLKEYNGKIAVFCSDEPEPVKVLERFVKELPEEDKKLINRGISVYSESQLQKLIEDYTS